MANLITNEFWKANTDIDYVSLGLSDTKLTARIQYSQNLLENYIGMTVASGLYTEKGEGRLNEEQQIYYQAKIKPIISITSLEITQVASVSFSSNDLIIDYNTGFIKSTNMYVTQKYSTLESRLFSYRSFPIVLTYVAGYETIPESISYALVMLTDYVISKFRQLGQKGSSKTGKELSSFSLGDLSESYVQSDRGEDINVNDNGVITLPSYITLLLDPYVVSRGRGSAGIY